MKYTGKIRWKEHIYLEKDSDKVLGREKILEREVKEFLGETYWERVSTQQSVHTIPKSDAKFYNFDE